MSRTITYSYLTSDDFEAWLGLAVKLWKDYSADELRNGLIVVFDSPNQKAFVAKNEDNVVIAFINASIRTDYVEGSDGSPTGYVEGIYVEPEYRRLGIAQKLVALAEGWLRTKGCKQIGADTWEWNSESIEFHKKLGFRVEATLVHFMKEIGNA